MRELGLSETMPSAGARAIAMRVLARRAALVAAFTMLTAAAGFVRVPLPFTPVPLTLQLIPVLLAGSALGPSGGAISQVLLLAAGVAGAPVFSGGSFGPGHLFGATGGYLIGFIAAAWLVGVLVHGPARSGFGRALLSMIAGAGVVHLFGALHLALFLGGSPLLAFQLGSQPFVVGDLLKAIIAASVAASWPGRRGQGAAPPA